MVEPRRVEPDARRELPQEGAQLRLEPQYAGGEEIGERGLYIMHLFEVGDETAALDGKDKAVRGLVMPSREGVGALERIMRAADLDRVDLPAGIGQLVGMAQPARIKRAAPAAVVPAGNADTDRPEGTQGGSPINAPKTPLRPAPTLALPRLRGRARVGVERVGGARPEALRDNCRC